MIAFLTRTLGGITDKDKVRIPIKDELSLDLYRSVFMKTPSWTIRGVGTKYKYGNIHFIYSFRETEETADKIQELTKNLKKMKDQDTMNKFVEKFIQDDKKNNPNY